MPFRKLPKEAVENARRLVRQNGEMEFGKIFAGLPNADKRILRVGFSRALALATRRSESEIRKVGRKERAQLIREQNRHSTSDQGFRVRQLDFPNLKGGIIIKKTDNPRSAKVTIEKIKQAVRSHKKKLRNDNQKRKRRGLGKHLYEMRMPHLYAIGEEYIAMRYFEPITLDELIRQRTKRAKIVRRNLEERGFKFGEVKDEINWCIQNGEISWENMYFGGVAQGKLIFMPLGDYY